MNEKLPERKATRLHNFDYSSTGAYFITVCVRDRMKILSEIVAATKSTMNLDSVGDGALDVPETLDYSPNFTAANEVLPHIVSTFKRFCNKEIGENIFQRSYYEHVIRDRKDYEIRKKYIYENPIKWYYDKVYEDEQIKRESIQRGT